MVRSPGVGGPTLAVSAVGSSRASPAGAIVVAGDEETRVLLRGLLRLHHVRVDGEAEGATPALELIRAQRPSLLVVDTTLAEGSAPALLSAARREVPTVRTVVVAPASRPPSADEYGGQADTVLLRPFRIRQFAEAIAPPPPPGPGPSPTPPGT